MKILEILILSRAIGALLVCDISIRNSFEELKTWLETIRIKNDKLVVLLVGNKSDLNTKRKVSREEGEEFAKNHGLSFIETSAQSGENVEAAFTKLAELVLEQIDQGKIVPTSETQGIKLGGQGNEDNHQNQSRSKCF